MLRHAMSKAFTDEEAKDVSTLGRVIERAAPGEERPITAEGHRALLERRIELAAERAKVAATTGVEREGRLDALDHALALVAATIDSVRVEPDAPSDGTVRFGSTVALDWDDGRKTRLRLVGPDEADGKERVSVASPLARQLLGRRRGETVEIERPRGSVEVTVREVT